MKIKGIIFTILSAVLFGITPVMGQITYSMGSNGITLAFYRYGFSLPLLYILTRVNKTSLILNKEKFAHVFETSLAMTATVILLYSSYSFIPVGTATTVHFLYPLMVTIGTALFYKDRISKTHIICITLCVIGIMCFLRESMGNGIVGFAMALLSSISFAWYMIGYDKFNVKDIQNYVFTFHLSWMVFIGIIIIGFFTGKLILLIPFKAQLINFVVAAMTTAAVIFLQKGIKELGAGMAAILSMFEPITSVLTDITIMHRNMPAMKIFGCIFILGGITYLIVYNLQKK